MLLSAPRGVAATEQARRSTGPLRGSAAGVGDQALITPMKTSADGYHEVEKFNNAKMGVRLDGLIECAPLGTIRT